ncbi:hypothetical protein K440DRAFT_251340 [Wilcoxina mikolae CBS 423.85]|nr:hypothetical protein K440DRAFT_251340 [Wilcoxina mikolae CBS 423.85]
MGLWDRVRWAQKEADLGNLLERLEVHKTSLGLILTILLCHSNAEAEKSTSHLTAQVEKLVESNERLMALVQEARPQSYHDHEEDAESIPPVDSHILRFDERTMVTVVVEPQSSTHNFKISGQQSMESIITSPVRFSFEDTLYKTRVYTRTVLNSTTNSFKSAQTIGSKWTQLTGLSLAQISNISVIHLPICASDIPNSAHWFKFGSYADPSIMGDHLSEIMEVSTVHAHSRQNSDGSNVASEKHWDNADTETIRERSPSRASRGVSGSYALPSTLDRDPSLAE